MLETCPRFIAETATQATVDEPEGNETYAAFDGRERAHLIT